MSKHTPGPWEWIESPEGYGFSILVGPDNAEVLVPGGINDGDTPITWMGGEMSEADMLLLKAAPNLLKWLRRCVNIVEVVGHCPMVDWTAGHSSLAQEYAAEARAAIAKATDNDT